MEKNQNTLFKTLWPGMMKHTRLLIVDHDVCSYHSLDLLRWQLDQDAQHGYYNHFRSLNKKYHYLLSHKHTVNELIDFMRNYFMSWNIYEAFDELVPGEQAVVTMQDYYKKLNQMFLDRQAKFLPTDMGTQLQTVFKRDDIKGFILRHKNDPCKPPILSDCDVYETDIVLNLDTICGLVKEKRINAIMISSIDHAMQLAYALTRSGYTEPITIMFGQYAYNMERGNETFLLKNNELMGFFELKFKYEFGSFDSFSGLTYMHRLDAQIKDGGQPNGSNDPV